MPQLYGANGSPLRVIGTVTADVSISGYLCPVEFIVINGLHHNVIFGISMLREYETVIDVSRSCLFRANNLLTVPLIQRFAPSTIVRTVSAITVAPYLEVRLPVHISQQYRLRPSIIEPLHTRYSSRIAVAKAYTVRLSNKAHESVSAGKLIRQTHYFTCTHGYCYYYPC